MRAVGPRTHVRPPAWRRTARASGSRARAASAASPSACQSGSSPAYSAWHSAHEATCCSSAFATLRVERAREILRKPFPHFFTAHGASSSLKNSARSCFIARWTRTLTAPTSIPSVSAIRSYGHARDSGPGPAGRAARRPVAAGPVRAAAIRSAVRAAAPDRDLASPPPAPRPPLHRRRPLLPEVVGPGVARDPEQPGVEPAAHVVGVAILQDSHEHLLHQVLGQRRVAGRPAEEVEHRTVMALEQFAEGVELRRPARRASTVRRSRSEYDYSRAAGKVTRGVRGQRDQGGSEVRGRGSAEVQGRPIDRGSMHRGPADVSGEPVVHGERGPARILAPGSLTGTGRRGCRPSAPGRRRHRRRADSSPCASSSIWCGPTSSVRRWNAPSKSSTMPA